MGLRLRLSVEEPSSHAHCREWLTPLHHWGRLYRHCRYWYNIQEVHKKVDHFISLSRSFISHTDAENFYNVFIFRVPKTLVRMFTLRCSNRNSQIAWSVRSLDVNMSVTSWMTLQRIFNTKSTVKCIILYRLRILWRLHLVECRSTLYKNEIIVEQQFT